MFQRSFTVLSNLVICNPRLWLIELDVGSVEAAPGDSVWQQWVLLTYHWPIPSHGKGSKSISVRHSTGSFHLGSEPTIVLNLVVVAVTSVSVGLVIVSIGEHCSCPFLQVTLLTRCNVLPGFTRSIPSLMSSKI